MDSSGVPTLYITPTGARKLYGGGEGGEAAIGTSVCDRDLQRPSLRKGGVVDPGVDHWVCFGCRYAGTGSTAAVTL